MVLHVMVCINVIDNARKFKQAVTGRTAQPAEPKPESSPDYGKDEVRTVYMMMVMVTVCVNTCW